MTRPAYTTKRDLVTTRFAGGEANDDKEGTQSSVAKLVGLEHRKHATRLTLKPKGRQDANQAIVTDLPVGAARVANGDTYFIGDTGRFYKRTVAGAYSLIGTLASASAKGILYRDDADAIYLTQVNGSVARYWPLSGSPVAASLTDPWCGNVVDQNRTSGATTYTTPVAIAETAANKFSFQPQCSPQYSTKVKVVAKGTGNWTLTLHDDANNNLGAATIANGSLTNGALNEFILPVAVSEYVKPNARTYHVHVTSTVADGTLQTATAADLSTADYETWAKRLETTRNGLHPIGQIAQYTLYGNGRYVAVHEPLTNSPDKLEFLSHKIVLPPGYECTGFSQYGELVAVTAEKRSSDNTARFQDGKIFVWDATASNYNYFVNVPSGSPYSPWTSDGILYYIVSGKIKAYNGSQPVTIHNMPGADPEYTDQTTYAVNYPYMATIRNEVAVVGWPSETNNPNAETALYSYGTIDKNYSPSFARDGYISSGTKFNNGSNNLRLGMVMTFGDDTFIGWRDDSQAVGHRYGIDLIDNFSDPVASASLESLKIDFGLIQKQKTIEGVIVTFEALPAGATVTPKYKPDRAGAWVMGSTAGAGSKVARFMFQHRVYEVEYGFDVTATTTTPVITGHVLAYDNGAQEQNHV